MAVTSATTIDKLCTFYRRNLPHWQPIGATFFVTFRLKDSVPLVLLQQLRDEYNTKIASLKKDNSSLQALLIADERKRFFARYDALLDAVETGPDYLRQLAIAQIVAKALHRFNGELYDMLAYCIMPNHVHILINTYLQLPKNGWDGDLESLNFKPLEQIMKRVKGASAVEANRLLQRHGKFWQKESYDHWVRDERELHNIWAYILNNPVKAGWVKTWEEWEFSWSKSLP